MGERRHGYLTDSRARAANDPQAVLSWFEGLLRRVVREELAEVVHPADDWRDQRRSQLGSRRHCAAVRRRLAENPDDPQAKIVGDRFLLTPSAIAEELARIGRKAEKPKSGLTAAEPTPASPEDEAVARMRRRLTQVK